MPKSHLIRRSATAVAALVCLTAIGSGPAWAHTASSAPVCAHSACLLAVRAGAHPDFDRLVFDLTDGSVRIRETASDSPDAYVGASGESKHVQIPGKSYLYLDIQPAHTVDDRGTPTFTGPPSQSFALPSLTGVELMGEWEGHLTAALSLGDYSRYRVFTLTSPNRLVIDVYH